MLLFLTFEPGKHVSDPEERLSVGLKSRSQARMYSAVGSPENRAMPLPSWFVLLRRMATAYSTKFTSVASRSETLDTRNSASRPTAIIAASFSLDSRLGDMIA